MALLAVDDYIYVASNLDRQTILAINLSSSDLIDHGRRIEVDVRGALDYCHAAVRHRYEVGGSFEGTSFTDEARVSWFKETSWTMLNRDGEVLL